MCAMEMMGETEPQLLVNPLFGREAKQKLPWCIAFRYAQPQKRHFCAKQIKQSNCNGTINSLHNRKLLQVVLRLNSNKSCVIKCVIEPVQNNLNEKHNAAFSKVTIFPRESYKKNKQKFNNDEKVHQTIAAQKSASVSERQPSQTHSFMSHFCKTMCCGL